MQTLILDGSQADDRTAIAIRDAIAASQPDSHTLTLRELTIGNCAGDFFCWIRSPGQCNVNDDNRVIAAEMMASDLIVLLTPVTFGGYGSLLKQAVDHLIQNLSPFFTLIDGETHHCSRYRRYPDLVVIGWLPGPDLRAEQVFRHLVFRNGLNFYAEQSRCEVLVGDLTPQQVHDRVRAVLDGEPTGEKPAPLPGDVPGDVSDDRPASAARHVVLLTGSPRTTTSSSHFFGSYLLERLADRGADVEEIHIHTTMASSHRRPAAVAAIDAADLLVLACPLYVDALPAPVTAALEHLHARRASGAAQTDQRLVALLNCGFPEPGHNATAMAIAAQSAHAIGARWAGGLALGGGEGVIKRQPLAERGHTAAPLRQALDLTAEALATGRPVPAAATALLEHPLIPCRLYTSIGQLSWIRQAHRYHATRQLQARPYKDAPAAASSAPSRPRHGQP